jgi:hypothetical protein
VKQGAIEGLDVSFLLFLKRAPRRQRLIERIPKNAIARRIVRDDRICDRRINKRPLMTDPVRVRCTKDDLAHVVDLFQQALEEELSQAPSASIDIRKVVLEYRNLLEQSCEVVPSFEEDQQAQELKSKIEACQRRGLRVKSTLHSAKTRFMDEVQLQTETMLEQQRPTIQPIDVDDELPIPGDCEAKLKVLDELIDQLRAQIGEAAANMEQNVAKVGQFANQARLFFDRIE